MKCYRFQKLLQTATASTIPVAVAITSTGKPASAFVPTKDVPRVRFSTHKPANASVQARESADLHLHTITTVADVSVQKIQVAVSHHIYSTSNSAHVSAQLNQNVQRHSGSILENACVNADIGQTSVLTNKSLMNTSANADAPKCSSALETNSSTTIPASVNVQNQIQNANIHKFTTMIGVDVNVQNHIQNANIRKFTTMVGADVNVPGHDKNANIHKFTIPNIAHANVQRL